MKKILLINDDYNELVHSESQLKKVGLDVVGLSNELSLSDQILTLNPDLVIASGQSQRVSSMSVAKKIALNRNFHGKVIVMVPKGVRPKPEELVRMKMDALVETPIAMERLLQVACKLLGLEYSGILEKLQRVQAQEELKKIESGSENAEKLARAKILRGIIGDSGAPSVAGKKGNVGEPEKAGNTRKVDENPQNARYADTQRMARYAEFLANEKPIDSKSTTFARDEIRQKQKDLKKDWNFEELEDIDTLKRDFANAMFRKK